MGYVLVKGKAYEQVSDAVTIFASPACHRVIRRGKNTPAPKNEPVNREEIQKAIEKEIKDAKPSIPGIGGIGAVADSILNLDNNATNEITLSSTKEEISKALENQGGFTQTPVTLAVTDTELHFQTKLDKLNAASEKLKNMNFPITSVSDLAAWFDDMEAVIDSLPTMSQDGGTVYVVEKSEDGTWRYTGESEPMDREWNAKLQGAKASVCMWLQKQTDRVVSEMESKLQDQLNRLDTCGPFTKVIQIITSVPSLTTIIDWAKGIIDFVVGIYKLIFSIYQMAIQMLEIIIIRFPQLINKLMSKVTEYNCPISTRVTINVKGKK